MLVTWARREEENRIPDASSHTNTHCTMPMLHFVAYQSAFVRSRHTPRSVVRLHNCCSALCSASHATSSKGTMIKRTIHGYRHVSMRRDHEGVEADPVAQLGRPTVFCITIVYACNHLLAPGSVPHVSSPSFPSAPLALAGSHFRIKANRLGVPPFTI